MESDIELAAHFDALGAKGQEFEGLTPVSAKVKPNSDVIYSIRFTRAEMDRINEYAKRHGLKVSSFIRQVTLAATEHDRDLEDAARSAALREVREHAHALAEAASRL